MNESARSTKRGAVIVPAYNEEARIQSTLAPLSQAASEGCIELIVVCNGCTDKTADLARAVEGAQVVESTIASKTYALNEGDRTATLWPRLYVDADVAISIDAVLAVLDRLATGEVLAARPAFRYGLDGADYLVRSYYRARTASEVHGDALWWAGVYGLSRAGHSRFGEFPTVVGDDKFVDSQFEHYEKAVVDCEPAIWRTPTNARGLIAVLTRHQRGNSELAALDPARVKPTSTATARAVLQKVRGPRSAADAVVYFGFAIAARLGAKRKKAGWERDESSRTRNRSNLS